jgi:predicted histidine transporter YuiF (NhaC family)
LNKYQNQNKVNSKKGKKDYIFTIVTGLILVNLVYFFAGAVSGFVTTRHIWAAIWIFTDGIAIIGLLYLIRTYNKTRKAERIENERKTREEEKLNSGISDGSI